METARAWNRYTRSRKRLQCRRRYGRERATLDKAFHALVLALTRTGAFVRTVDVCEAECTYQEWHGVSFGCPAPSTRLSRSAVPWLLTHTRSSGDVEGAGQPKGLSASHPVCDCRKQFGALPREREKKLVFAQSPELLAASEHALARDATIAVRFCSANGCIVICRACQEIISTNVEAIVVRQNVRRLEYVRTIAIALSLSI